MSVKKTALKIKALDIQGATSIAVAAIKSLTYQNFLNKKIIIRYFQ